MVTRLQQRDTEVYTQMPRGLEINWKIADQELHELKSSELQGDILSDRKFSKEPTNHSSEIESALNICQAWKVPSQDNLVTQIFPNPLHTYLSSSLPLLPVFNAGGVRNQT